MLTRRLASLSDEDLFERFKCDIAPRFDSNYSARSFDLVRNTGFLEWFFEKITVIGTKNAEGARTKIYFGNHQSHFDYALAWYAFKRLGVQAPHFAAGKNLDHPLVLGIFGMDFRKQGSFFVDRDLVAERDLRINRIYLRVLREVVHGIIDSGEGIFVFPEGGRSYDGDVMGDGKNLGKITGRGNKVKKTIFKLITEPMDGIEGRLRDIDVVPVAFAYSNRVEEDAFELLKYVKGRRTILQRTLYYGLDIGSFALRPIRQIFNYGRPFKAALAFGEPINLREAVGDAEPAARWDKLRTRVVDEVRELHKYARKEAG